MKKITRFRGEFGWLSNFAMVEIYLHGRRYSSVEHAYLASKSSSEEWRDLCSEDRYDAGLLKKESKNIKLVEDWEDIKVGVMQKCLIQKFTQEPYRTKLINTGNRVIEEGNHWNDKFWGVCLKTNEGDNMLGKLIMKIRTKLIEIQNEKNKQKFVVGERVSITENAKALVGIYNDHEYKIFDILKLKVNSPYVLTCEDFGDGWRGFFSKDELIKIKNNENK